jgi:pimeloyl-ACP methyl ester carboxylesterase
MAMMLVHPFFMRVVCFIGIISFLLGPLRVDFYIASNDVFADDPVVLEDLHITEDVLWTSDTDLSLYEKIFVEDNSTVTIEKGSTISVRHINVLNGRIVAEGTIEEMITMRGIQKVSDDEFDPYCGITEALPTIQFDGYADFEDDPVSTFSFVRFENMGVDHTFDDEEDCPAMAMKDRVWDLFFPSAYAAEVTRMAPAVLYRSGKVHMKSCIFEGNATADVQAQAIFDEYYNVQGYLHIENSNFNNNSQNIAVESRFVEMLGPPSFDVMDCFGSCMSDHWGTEDEMNHYNRCYNMCNADQDGSHDNSRVVLKNNWYGHENGPSGIVPGDIETGLIVYGDVTLQEWRPTSDFASNVLFLPGVKASRLHHDSNQVWPPTIGGSDYEELLLDEDGKSIEDIFTDEPIDEVGLPSIAGANIYKRFFGDLAGLKDDRIIRDYGLYAYDWRQSVDDIVENGTQYENEIKYPIEELERLAETSVSGNVTIVAHSNGGLLTKAIMEKLEDDSKTGLVDNIILVSSPQMGTPKAILTMLYGFDEKAIIPWLISDAEARQVVENMPSAYGLLPTEEYFDRTEESIIDFDARQGRYKKYYDAYGDQIDDHDELRDFLLAIGDDREKPAKNDTSKANILNEELFDRNTDLHEQLNDWIPPGDVHLIQIGGWGLDTISGVTYAEKPIEECERTLPFLKKVCHETGEYESFYKPIYTVDGDETVVTSSSLMLEESENVERYWLNMFKFNDIFYQLNRDHANILEIEQLRELISHVAIKHNVQDELPEYIVEDRPDDNDVIDKSKKVAQRIRMSLYSPLDIHLYDRDGNHTGPGTDEDGNQIIEENIPNSYYDVFGKHKYVGWSEGNDVRVELRGYDEGSYTVKLEEVSITDDGEQIDKHVTLTHLPASEDTVATFTVPETGLEDITELHADYNGDGINDYTVTPQIDGEATIEVQQGSATTSNDSSDDDDDENDDEEDSSDDVTLSWTSSTSTEVDKSHDNNYQKNDSVPNKSEKSSDNEKVDEKLEVDEGRGGNNFSKLIFIGIILLSSICIGIFIFKKAIK